VTVSRAQAEKAVELFSDDLVKGGAHAIGTEAGAAHGRKGYVVVAYVEPKTKVAIPERLKLPPKHGGAEVPVITKTAARFKPQ